VSPCLTYTPGSGVGLLFGDKEMASVHRQMTYVHNGSSHPFTSTLHALCLSQLMVYGHRYSGQICG